MTNSETRMHYYVRISADGRPVVGSLIARLMKPKDGGRWANITNCLGLCCRELTLHTVGNLSAVNKGGATATNIILSWGTVPNATGYTAERSTSADFSTALTTVYTGGANGVDVGGLTASTHYYFRVKATAPGFVTSPYAYADQTTSA